MHLVTTILIPILLVIIHLGPDKPPKTGTHREISRFPGGPVRLCAQTNI